jgi:hypothetical protein
LIRSQALYPIELRAPAQWLSLIPGRGPSTPRLQHSPLMPTTGLEPVRPFGHWSLKPACLPIPARGQRHRNTTAMLGEGLEPSQGYPHRILNPARLPIPPPELQVPWSGAEGNRTPDLLNAIQALSQLSYSPSTDRNPDFQTAPTGLTGLEPAASGVTDRHSNRLSYSPPLSCLPATPPRGIEPRSPP